MSQPGHKPRAGTKSSLFSVSSGDSRNQSLPQIKGRRFAFERSLSTPSARSVVPGKVRMVLFGAPSPLCRWGFPQHRFRLHHPIHTNLPLTSQKLNNQSRPQNEIHKVIPTYRFLKYELLGKKKPSKRNFIEL